METDELVQELNLIYTIGSACPWWDEKMTEALSEATDKIQTADLIRANVNILSRLVKGEEK